MPDPVIAVADLRMRYGGTDVLRGVTFEVRRGEVVALLGPNGAGKTTTIEILEGFRGRSGGQVSVLGADPFAAGETWRAQVGVVLQSWRDHGKWRVRELLAQLGAYYPDPWDPAELMTGFDPAARRDFHALIAALETTILLTTHDLDEAARLADRILVLDEGRVIGDGTAAELVHRFAGPDEVSWSLAGERFVRQTGQPALLVHDLYREHGETLHDLQVRRASLEDTYLAMVRRAEGAHP